MSSACFLEDSFAKSLVRRNRRVVGLNKSDYKSCKFYGQFQIGKMACVVENDSARAGDAGFDGSGVGMHVGNIGVTDEQERRNMNFLQARESRLDWEFKVRVR